jgi:hypothetical protein
MSTILAAGKRHARLVLIFLSGVAVGVCALIVLADVLRPPAQPLGAVPRDRDSVLVLQWLLDTRADAARLRFMAWWPPVPRPDNPITHHPAVLVHVALTASREDSRIEDLLVYVEDNQVLGAVRNGQGDTDPRAPVWTARSEPAVQPSHRLPVPGPHLHPLDTPAPRG